MPIPFFPARYLLGGNFSLIFPGWENMFFQLFLLALVPGIVIGVAGSDGLQTGLASRGA